MKYGDTRKWKRRIHCPSSFRNTGEHRTTLGTTLQLLGRSA
jgi:hypothetical protein